MTNGGVQRHNSDPNLFVSLEENIDIYICSIVGILEQQIKYHSKILMHGTNNIDIFSISLTNNANLV